jgi:hypothetical protein
MPLGLMNVVGCGPTKPFQVSEGNHDAWQPPSIRANVAVVNDEMASASHRYGYYSFQNKHFFFDQKVNNLESELITRNWS